MNDLAHVKTPAFLVDQSIVRQNCDAMREKARASGVAFRPHAKTHKTIEVARMQHGGAIGPLTVSTLAEAEFYADAGFRDITYAVPIAPDKLERAAALGRRIDRLHILIDSAEALRGIEEHGGPFHVWLKVDCGYHRAGVDPSSWDSVQLATAIAQSPAATLEGLLTHAGHSYHARNVDEIRRLAADERGAVTKFRSLLPEELQNIVRSIGSTPTTAVVDAFTDCDEVRPGNYVFYDAFQSTIGSCRFEDVAVSVLATVVGSYPERGEAIIDAGALALSKDLGADHIDSRCGYGVVCDLDLKPIAARLVALSQEHGKLTTNQPLPVGTKLRIMPNHSCLTSAMFDRYCVIENGKVVGEWRPVRGW
jgi:D-serine deaminase-like pyridoxal phosphate-dependent protein